MPVDACPQPGARVGELPGRETQAQAETPGDDGRPWGPEQGHRTRVWGPGLYWWGTCRCGCSVPGRPAGTQGPALGLQQEALRLQSNEGHEGSARRHPEIQAGGPPSSRLPPKTHRFPGLLTPKPNCIRTTPSPSSAD